MVKLNMEKNLIENLHRKLSEESKGLKGKYDIVNTEHQKLVNYVKGQRKIYIPKKNDKIDAMLGEAINNFPEREKIKIMFLRESDGVYRFGSRRVQIKIEHGEHILVRVGGGYMALEDFIRQFSEQEAQKISRRDVVKRFKGKVNAQKIALNESISKVEARAIGDT